MSTGSLGSQWRGGWRGGQQMTAQQAVQRSGCGTYVGSPVYSWGCSRGVHRWPRAAGWWKSGRESRGPTPGSWCSRYYRRTRSPLRPGPDLTERRHYQLLEPNRGFKHPLRRAALSSYLWREVQCSRQRLLLVSWTGPERSRGRRQGCPRWTQSASKGSGKPLQHPKPHIQLIVYEAIGKQKHWFLATNAY